MPTETRLAGQLDVSDTAGPVRRERIVLTGVVQGVGYRPHVYRLAQKLNVGGWVKNTSAGLVIEAEAAPEILERFVADLRSSHPPHALISNMQMESIPARNEREFSVLESDASGLTHTLPLQDLAICADCLRDIRNPRDRRFRHPFANCTQCGPRFSILRRLPYDRENTTMQRFAMCRDCAEEYADPGNRRFHAQPIACPACGPSLQLLDSRGASLAVRDEALRSVAAHLRGGKIVAVKGIGGFHLLADARNHESVARLRSSKRRESGKAFAVMFPSLADAAVACALTDLEKQLLMSASAPIVLVERRQDSGLAESVAPDNPLLGAFLPYTALHQILLDDLGFPVVATSGNVSEEIICIDNTDALARLSKIADLFLMHDREIARPMDDSVVRVMLGNPRILRRARGYAPLPVADIPGSPATLALGGHLKNTLALSTPSGIFVSQHLGDLETKLSRDALNDSIRDYTRIVDCAPNRVVCDIHPDYASTRVAEAMNLPVIRVQHHEAHILSCVAENNMQPPCTGIAWDGAGLGRDGTIWGGEFFAVGKDKIQRIARLRPFLLTGGEQSIREPRRSALALLHELFGDSVFDRRDLPSLQSFLSNEKQILRAAMAGRINSFVTSSMGRLFDAVASLLDLCHISGHEAQAAQMLEFTAMRALHDEAYPLPVDGSDGHLVDLDWRPLVSGMICDIRAGVSHPDIALKFHNALAEGALSVARIAGERNVVLSGGCFQNKILLERVASRLASAGFVPCVHRLVPANDGGLSLGQIAGAARSFTLAQG